MYETELAKMIEAVKKSNLEIKRIYQAGFTVKLKADHSPVTDADLASNKIIRDTLSCFKDISWLSEEDIDDVKRMQAKKIFIIDPLDGTQDFVNHDGSFGVNLALVEDRHPVVAVIGVPMKQAYAYAVIGQGSYYVDAEGHKTRMHVSSRTKDLILVFSMTHVNKEEETVFNKHKTLIKEIQKLGASTKAIAIASGLADCCIRYTNATKEWDVCAPELIVTEAGGVFTDTNLKPFIYNRKNVYNEDGYCMFNRKENEILLK
ncbi:MAG: 3'(2'),5'-bisphosphate nucleotidase CysQ [Bacilli bacterium]|jgi:3'(2'), 5'-bisphosphate nucleotidase